MEVTDAKELETLRKVKISAWCYVLCGFVLANICLMYFVLLYPFIYDMYFDSHFTLLMIINGLIIFITITPMLIGVCIIAAVADLKTTNGKIMPV